jgi:hypothetical protein
MRKLDIKDKLIELNIPLDELRLGDFDRIGDLTARKLRSASDPNYSRFGAFFRPNYERGILIYSLILRGRLKSVLEIGFGRGYGALCAARAFHDAGIDGKVTSVDPMPAGCSQLTWRSYERQLFELFPWAAKHLDVVIGPSSQIIPTLQGPWDLVYIDGDHSYDGTKADWNSVDGRWNRHVLFDDYHLPTKADPGIECSRAIDEIPENEQRTKELIITDRRLFCDDRGLADDQIDYGQVLLTKNVTVTGGST